MYPLTGQLADSFEIFCEQDYIRPEKLLEKISKDYSPALPKLVLLYNHVKMHPEPSFRHREIYHFLDEILSRSFFVPKVGPLKRERRCFIQRMPAEVLQNIFRCMGLGEFRALTQCSRTLLHVGYEMLARQPTLLTKYVATRLIVESKVKNLFFNRSYATPIHLQLVGTEVKSRKILQRFPAVCSLSLHAVPISRRLLNILQAARQLTTVEFHQINDDAINKISLPESVTSCHFLGTNISNQTIMDVAKSCPHLEELSLTSCSHITHQAFRVPFPNLRELKLSHRGLSDDDLAFILRACPNLRTLLLMGCHSLTGSALAMASQLPFLEELNISGCEELTEANFLAIMARASSIQSLNISHCWRLSKNTFIEASYPATLKNLLAHCCNIDDEGLQKVLQLPQLEILDVSNAFLLTKNAFKGLTVLPRLKQVCFEGTYAEKAYLQATQNFRLIRS